MAAIAIYIANFQILQFTILHAYDKLYKKSNLLSIGERGIISLG
jgi:hypothetical protein